MPGPPAPVRPLLAAGALGWCAGLGQVVLLRELLVIAGGNELVLAVGLALWLGLSGLGCLAAGRWSRGGGFSAPLVWAGAGPLAGLVLARLAPHWAGLTPGAVPGLAGLAGLGLVVLGPSGLAVGAAFPCLMAAWSPIGAAQAPGLARLYALEALGAALAGALFALVLAGRVPAPGLLALGGLLPALMAGLAAGGWRWPALIWAAGLAVALIFGAPLDHALRQAQWPGWRVLGQAETPYAQLLAAGRGGQVNFFAGGQWLFSLPDPEARERAALTPLLARPDAARILFLGGGASGSAALAARHAPAAAVTAVELDPWLEAFRQRQTPDPAPANLANVYADPRGWLQGQVQTSATAWDLIVVEQPPPDGLAANRYYSRAGFAALAAGLGPGGVAVLSLPGVGDMLGPLQARQLGAIVAAARESFGQVLLLTGPELRLACAQAGGAIPAAPEAWIARLAGLGGESLTGLRPDLLGEMLDPWRARQLLAAIDQTGPHAANADLRPRALLYDPQLWGAQLGRAGGLALALGRLSAWPLALGLLVLAGLGWAVGGRGQAPGQAPGRGLLGWGLVVTGALSLALSLCLMLGYQVLYGSVYLGLALLMAAFMLGLAGAAWAMGRWPAALAWGRRGLALAGLGLGLACLAAWALIAGLAGSGAAHGAWAATLLLLAGVDGGLTGAYFSLAGRLWAGPDAGGGRLAGAVYGLDLLGGVLGALWPLALASSLGLGPALGLLALLALGPALGQWRGRARP